MHCQDLYGEGGSVRLVSVVCWSLAHCIWAGGIVYCRGSRVNKKASSCILRNLTFQLHPVKTQNFVYGQYGLM